MVSKNVESDSFEGINVQFQVDHSYKGRVYGIIDIKTSPDVFMGGGVLGGDPFIVGEKFFVFATRNDDYFYVDQNPCGSLEAAFPIEDWNEIRGYYSIAEPEILPPKFQISLNIPPSEIMCKETLELIFKHDNSPACVKPTTAQKLIERGWTITLS